MPSHCKRKRNVSMSLSEMLTIIIMFHESGFRNFKTFYTLCIDRKDFNYVLSYNRFIQLQSRLFLPLAVLVHYLKGEETGIYFIDSTTIGVCNNKRRNSNKVFKELAASGKSSMGYFFGLKLHIIINQNGEIVALQITRGNVDDRVPVPKLTQRLEGKIFAT